MDSDDEPLSKKVEGMDIDDSEDDKPLYQRVQRRASAGMLIFSSTIIMSYSITCWNQEEYE
jgi:hypothetical protein